MCQNPKYLPNPTLKKIEETGEIDIKKCKRYKGHRFNQLSYRDDGTPYVSTYDNDVDLSKFGDKFKGYYLPLYIKVPCGVCADCMRQKVNQIVSRMQIELQNHNNFGIFVTLTYSDEHLPHRFIDDEGKPLQYPVPTVCKEDVQKFLKRLRARLDYDGHDISNFKYFYISEYGMTNTDNKRPHYHLCLFFDELPMNIISDYIHECWTFGNITLDSVNESRLRYCANSHATASKLFPINKGALPPFSHWSKGFGLPQDIELYHHIRGRYKVDVNGNSYPIGRYLRDKLFTIDEINKRQGAFTSVSGVDDDFLQSLKSASLRLFPRTNFDDLSREQFARVRNYVSSSYQAKNDNYFKRYVLKRK
jgi:hypothetical protein